MSTDSPILGTGALCFMEAQARYPVAYSLHLDATVIPLNELLGETLVIEFAGRISCRHCGATTQKSYGEGYCYPCFKTLARCDLCVVSPDRCHYAAGTCREPAWGEAFCMQPHLVYLANSAGAKVGITKRENLPARWLDQGATQALAIMYTETRHQAGCVEAALARHVTDRTDWRGLIGKEADSIDLPLYASQLRRAAAHELAALARTFPNALQWADEELPVSFEYPVLRYGSPARGLALAPDEPVEGVLLGIKGQYLMFDCGVFNVRRHTSYHVTLRRGPSGRPRDGIRDGVRAQDQLELFQ
jgi:Protein of unknown function (DUF2797)